MKSHLETYRRRTYADLVTLIDEVQVAQLTGPSSAEYTVEINITWDDRAGGDIRVMASIDDGGWRAFIPLCEDFIMAPDGSFVGE